jgi:membrane-bound lytic murein transglycosylase F
MKKISVIFFSLAIVGGLWFFYPVLKSALDFLFKKPYVLDLQGIEASGKIRVAIDNNSTGYYIYRGRRMGFEYELLLDLAERLDLQLDLVTVSDIHKAFEYLEEGKVDLIAMNLAENQDQNIHLAFTSPLGRLSTVLVHSKNSGSLNSWDQLANDTIYVRQGAVYANQLAAIKDSLQLQFTILATPEHEEILINQVVDGLIKWTVADQNIAQVNATHYENLDISWKLKDEGKISWVVRKSSPLLLDTVNNWLGEKQKKLIPELYAKYFLNSKNSYFRNNSPYSSLAGNQISVYDELIRKGAEELGWDWRLLASLVYKESRFDTSALSYAGAQGLLQLMPVTLARFGVTDPNDPVQSLMGGVKYLKYLDKFWMQRVPETKERIKFILASYNIGHGHVEDAWKLTLKYGKRTQVWQEVSKFLEMKSDPQYYRDPIVKSGYAKGHLAVGYVKDVIVLFESYKALVEP